MATSSKSLGLRIALVLALIVGAILGVRSWMRPEALVGKVRSDIATNAVSGSVIVQAEYAMELKSEVPGRVISTNLEIDKRVKAGDLLLQLDTGDLLVEIEKTQSELEAARRKREAGSGYSFEVAAEKENLTELERQNKLGLVSDVDVTRQRRRVAVAQQKLDLDLIASKLAVETLESTLKGQQRRVQKMTLRADFDGIVARVDARTGDLISSGAPIAQLISTSRTVEGRLSEENIAGVKVGQKAIVSFLSYGDERFDAKVSKVLSTSDPQTQRYVIHLEIDPKQLPPARLVPGITGEMSVIIDEHPAKAIVARRALFGNKLFVVKDGRVELRTVKLGYVSLSAVEILEGVTEGELVIVDQLDRFSDGKAVKVVLTNESRWR
jgi:RND family efflux transporter MFP subunit